MGQLGGIARNILNRNAISQYQRQSRNTDAVRVGLTCGNGIPENKFLAATARDVRGIDQHAADIELEDR